MMPAILPRRRDAALQQHRTETRARSFPAIAHSLRIIIRSRGSHICPPPPDCGGGERAVATRRLLAALGSVSPRSARPLARGHATVPLRARARARAVTSRGSRAARAPGASREGAYPPRARLACSLEPARDRRVTSARGPLLYLFLIFILESNGEKGNTKLPSPYRDEIVIGKKWIYREKVKLLEKKKKKEEGLIARNTFSVRRSLRFAN